MAITESFRKAISAGDVRGIRIMMKDSLLVDPTFHEFDEMENLACNVSGLYDAHDGREFVHDSSFWNDNYMNKLMVQVVGNFSHERMDHLKKVVRHLRSVPTRPQLAADDGRCAASPQPQAQRRYQEQKSMDERNGKTIQSKISKIAIASVAGGVAGGIVAAVMEIPIMAGVVVGAFVVGAGTAVVNGGSSNE